MQVEVTIVSGRDLHNVNWRHGDLKPYAVLWIDSGPKCTTKVDVEHDENPKWDEKLFVTLTPASCPDTAVLYIDVVHANGPPGTKPLIGSTELPLREMLKLAQMTGKEMTRILKLKRPSGRPHGTLEIKIGLKDHIAGYQAGSSGQPAYYGHGAPPPQRPVYQHPYHAPAAPPPAYPTTYGYGARPPVQAYGGRQPISAPVTNKNIKHDKQTGLAGTAAGLFKGLSIAERVVDFGNKLL